MTAPAAAIGGNKIRMPIAFTVTIATITATTDAPILVRETAIHIMTEMITAMTTPVATTGGAVLLQLSRRHLHKVRLALNILAVLAMQKITELFTLATKFGWQRIGAAMFLAANATITTPLTAKNTAGFTIGQRLWT